MRGRDAVFALLLFLLVFGVYATSPVTQSTDSRYSLHLVKSIITEHNLNMDEYKQLIPSDDYRIDWVDGHIYPWHPIGTALLTVPIMALCNFVDPRCLGDIEAIYAVAELTIASFFSALVVVLIYFIARFSLSDVKSVVLALVVAFATSLWSVASRALHQHAPSMMLLCIALLLLLAARRRPWLVQFAGIPLALSYFVRPTNSVSIALLTLYVFLEYRRYIPGYLLGAALVTAPFLWVNLRIYGSLQSPYFAPNRVGATQHFLEALAGNLISPSRGLLIYSPVLLLSIAGVALKARAPGLNKLDLALLLAIGLHWAAVSSHILWWGGWAYGPRFFADMLPYFAFFLIPVVDRATQSTTGPLPALFGLLLAVSMFMHYQGATAPATFDWNSVPSNVDYQPARVWEWRDPQFLRGAAWFDRILPATIEISPANLFIRPPSRESLASQVPLTIRLSRGTRFDWKSETGAEVTLSPDHEAGVTEAKPVADIRTSGDLTETRRLGEIRILARPSNDPHAEWRSVSVPVDLGVAFSFHSYLPSVYGPAHRDPRPGPGWQD
jgi:hypothetical protein